MIYFGRPCEESSRPNFAAKFDRSNETPDTRHHRPLPEMLCYFSTPSIQCPPAHLRISYAPVAAPRQPAPCLISHLAECQARRAPRVRARAPPTLLWAPAIGGCARSLSHRIELSTLQKVVRKRRPLAWILFSIALEVLSSMSKSSSRKQFRSCLKGALKLNQLKL